MDLSPRNWRHWLPTTPGSMDGPLPPLTPALETSSDHSPREFHSATKILKPPVLNSTPDHCENSERNLSMNSNKPVDLKDPVAMTYLVSFLHALPFNYRIGPLPFGEAHDLFQFPSSQELREIGQELGLDRLNQRLMVSLPHNPLYMLNNCATLCETLMSCLPWTEYIGLAVTLTSMMYPFHYRWN